jgi:hypothetical protein
MQYRVKDADGKVHVIDGPDDATPSEIEAAAAQVIPKVKAEPRHVLQDLYAMRENIIPSAKRLATGLAGAVMHPVDTVTNALDLGAGGLRNIMPFAVRSAVDSVDTPENQQAGVRASAIADQFGGMMTDRYGGIDKIKKTMIADPVGVAADVSSVLGLGGGVAKAAGMGTVSRDMAAASGMINPLSLATPVVKGAATLTTKALKHAAGFTTGTGAEAFGEAAKAGFKGDKTFWPNFTGDVPVTDVLQQAKQGLANMGREKSAEYRLNMARVTKDATVLKFDGIDKAVSDASGMVSFKGQVKYPKAAQAVQQMADKVAEWKALDPAQFHTPEGLDALKQSLGGILEGLDFNEKTARLAAGKIYNATKNEIVKQAPIYADTMKAYSTATEQISEIERALSLGTRASNDTAMRKLQSLMRNNVQTNYGNRLDLARTLQDEGGVNLLPALSGQALNSWEPRSLAGKLGGGATLGVAAFAQQPWALAALPAQSPKAMGGLAYGGGRLAGLLDRQNYITGPGLKVAGVTAAQLEGLLGQ